MRKVYRFHFGYAIHQVVLGGSMYAQMVDTGAKKLRTLEEMAPEERAFQERIDADIKILFVVHPAGISDTAQFAIDQFLLKTNTREMLFRR